LKWYNPNSKSDITLVRNLALYLLFVVLIATTVSGQEPVLTFEDPEAGFSLMRSYAENGEYDLAKKTGHIILQEEPDYHDVSLYLARVLGWEGSYDSAYALVDSVIEKEPELLEAYETGQEKYDLSRSQRASERQIPEAYLHYYYDHFGVPYARNWHMLTAGGSIPVRGLTLLPYVNAGYHAGGTTPSTDIQFNLDSYVKLGRLNYALLGYGFSPDGILNYLPVHRGVAELWQSLPSGFAVSAGLRYFFWDESFIFLTLSGEKYYGDYWFSLRNYLFFKDYGVSASFYLTARRYLGSSLNYVALTAGIGAAPDEPVVVASDLDRLNAVSLRAEAQYQINERFRLAGMVGVAREEYTDRQFRGRIDFKVGTYIRLGR
jgi:YaiO family outer membrane protein